MNKEIVQYVREGRGRRKGQIRGVVVATGTNKVGWSFTNIGKGDSFNKLQGISIARTRANHGFPKEIKVPHNVTPILAKVAARAVKYFKPATVAA